MDFDIILFVYILCCPTCSCKDGFIDDSVITYDEVIEETKTIPKKFKWKKVACKRKTFITISSHK